MKSLFAIGTLLAACGIANADPILQFDVNAFNVQTTNSGGVNSPFGGVNHTGSVVFSMNPSITVLNGMAGNVGGSGPLINLGFSGAISNFSGHIDLVNGQVMGGSLSIQVNGGTDSYTTDVQAAGSISTYIGGGYTMEGLSLNGAFSDSQFGNVDVSNFFNHELVGSFLQFNWTPDQNGSGSGDMDVFVSVVPLPTGVWMGAATMGGLAIARKRRRSLEASRNNNQCGDTGALI